MQATLSPNARTILQVITPLGRPFSVEEVARRIEEHNPRMLPSLPTYWAELKVANEVAPLTPGGRGQPTVYHLRHEHRSAMPDEVSLSAA